MICRSRPRGVLILVLLAATVPCGLHAQAQVERNVVYGMYSGLALLMDVYYSEEPKGVGIVIVPLAGWYAPLDYDGRSAKDAHPENHQFLVDAGFTVFIINVRASPRFRYPAPLEDAQRAVRFIRFNAERFGIRPAAIGGMGFSASAHIAGLLGTLDGEGDPDDSDPINQVSAKLQCVVAGAMPSDLTRPIVEGRFAAFSAAAITSFLGAPPIRISYVEDPYTVDIAREASPLHHASSDDAPFFLEHGDADEVVSIEQAELMAHALREAGVPVHLRRVVGGDHGGPGWVRHDTADRYTQIIGWFDRHLGASPLDGGDDRVSHPMGL